MVGGDAVSAVVGAGRMFYDAGVPYVGYSELLYLTECLCCYFVEFAASVCGDVSCGNAVLCVVAEKSGQQLVYYYF